MVDRSAGILTDAQEVVYVLRERDGLEWADIAERQGFTRQHAQKLFSDGAKLVRAGLDGGEKIEVLVPSYGSDALMQAQAGEAVVALRRAAKDAGLKPQMINSLIRRIDKASAGGPKALKALKNDQIIELLEDRIGAAFEYIDDAALATASAPALATVVGIFVDKLQLLKGQPTSIVSMEDRRHLGEIRKALLEEMDRRSKTIEGTAEVVNQ